MKLITCAGYHGTGSSVITDIMSEFDNCKSLGEYEFRFIQDPNGISDLEYNLVENNHRLNSSNAIKKFKKNIDFLSGNILMKKYEKYFHDNFKRISYQYIEDLTDIKFKATWHQDFIEKGKLFYLFTKVISKPLNTFYKIITNNKEKTIPLFRNEDFYLSVPRENFYLITKKYLNSLFEIINSENYEFLALDQLVPPSNIDRYLKYFSNLKVIVIDRDPRDLYLLEKYVWRDNVIPTQDVNIFVKWYEKTREHVIYERKNDNVLRVKFEDFIYSYEDTLETLYNFLEIDKKSHYKKKYKFNPEVSIKNTRLWERNIYANEIESINYIRDKLGAFCYD